MGRGHLVLAALTALAISSSSIRAEPVCSLDSLPQLPDVTITSVTTETKHVPHCKVVGVIGTETNFELLMPDDWNGKFVMGGGGGFVGIVVNTAMGLGPLQSGYATVGTDTGHRGHPIDASWALNNLERIVSFGHQAVHRTAVTAKALIADYYGQDISRSLFFGCSRGGGQALMEAQRYPEDFDGIVAGAPAYSWTVEFGARNTRLNQAMYPNPDDLSVATITPAKQQLIGNAVMKQCDAIDGIEDGILNNPRQCEFDVASLACEGDVSDTCLSEQEIAAARTTYDDVYINGERVFPGYPVGAELYPGGWTRWLTGGLDSGDTGEFQEGAVVAAAQDPAPVTPNAHFAFGNGVMKYLVFHDPDWDYSQYSFDTFFSDVAVAAQTLDATDPNLDAFRARGGKLLMTNSWGDMAISAYGTIEYYDSVIERDPSAADDIRLMIFPGVEHCSGGPGPSWVNYIDVIDDWVETGEAPDRLTAFWLNEQNQPEGSRPACAYPKHLVYKGSGDTRDASSFKCVSEE
jgi:tannase/feruloyl esterase